MGYMTIRSSGASRAQARSLMPSKGLDLRDLPQLLSPELAIKMTNYISDAQGRLKKRKGINEIFSAGGTDPITFVEKYTDDIFVFGYGTTVAAYTVSTDTITNIKTDFTDTDALTGVRYGTYFFVSNGVEKIWRIDTPGTFNINEIAASKPATVLRIIGARLFANTDVEGETVYSEIDDGTDPPFTNWTVDTLADGPGLISDRFIGNVNSIEPLGEHIVVFGDNGKFAFFINTIDSAGTLSRVDVFQMSRRDFGGASGALTTDIGLVYFNEAGLWTLVSIGQPNIPFSDQEGLITQLLGVDYFDNATLTNADIVYDQKQNLILLTYGDDSSTNNAVICYNTQTKAVSEFSGWTFNRFVNDNGTLYGGSSVEASVHEMFIGYDDNGISIGTEFEQELELGSLEQLKDIGKFYVQGSLTQNAPVTISFNVYDRTGRYDANRMQYTWEAEIVLGSGAGYDMMAYDSGAYGGDLDSSELVESFDGAMTGIKRALRLRVNFSASDTSEHEINWFSVMAKQGALARRRQLTKI